MSDEINIGPMMFVPLTGHHRTRGVIAVGRHPGRPRYTDRDVDPAVAFANHATLALELADGRADHQRVRMLEERDRVAGELQDRVLQRLFATGMSMQAIAGAVGAPHADRIRELIEATDETIAGIRAVLTGLDAFGAVDASAGSFTTGPPAPPV